MDIYSPGSLELREEEATPVETEEVLPGTLIDQTPFMIVMEVMGTLEHQEEVEESKLDNHMEGWNNVSVNDVEEDGHQ